MTATGLLALTPPPRLSLARVVDATRRGLVQSCRDLLPEPEATLVLGEVAGIRGHLPAALEPTSSTADRSTSWPSAGSRWRSLPGCSSF
jgi:hypothetical protein